MYVSWFVAVVIIKKDREGATSGGRAAGNVNCRRFSARSPRGFAGVGRMTKS
jgi:hypothetical protein